MHKISVKGYFSSAHFLRNYKGKCEKTHGHNWGVEVVAESSRLQNGMVMDFGDLKKLLERALSRLDHSFLNESGYFKKINPTSENIAEYIFIKLAKKMPTGVKLKEVRVSETEKNTASYSPE